MVVGGGPTGVELAGALGEMSRFTLARDFRNIDPALARVILIEAGPRILPSFPESLARRAMRDLEALGVQVWTSSPVTRIDAERRRGRARAHRGGDDALGRGRAGLAARQGARPRRPTATAASWSAPTSRCATTPRCSCSATRRTPRPERRAAAGPRAGRDAAGPLRGAHDPRRAARAGRAVRFRYRDRGQMATIGRSRAICDTGRLRFGGFAAWVFWLCVHIYFLVGFKNRLFVVLQWAWSYLSYGRGARLIVSPRLEAKPGELPG